MKKRRLTISSKIFFLPSNFSFLFEFFVLPFHYLNECSVFLVTMTFQRLLAVSGSLCVGSGLYQFV